MAKLIFTRVLDLSDLPHDWSVVRVASDWFGQPLVLIAEGKPKRPDLPCDAATWVAWSHTQPKAHYLIYMDNGVRRHLRFEDAVGKTIYHIQPIEGGWLLGERRGAFGLYDRTGIRRASLDLGDASEDVQTTPDGKIWVSYFDEGVFGGTVAKEGVVCFDLRGRTQFRFAQFAEENKLPFVADCYAMNVGSSGDVWLSYYMEFPLVHIVAGVVEKCVLDFGPVGNDFAVRNDQVLYSKSGEVKALSISASMGPETVDVRDEFDNSLVPIADPHVGFIGRGQNALLNTGKTIYGLF